MGKSERYGYRPIAYAVDGDWMVKNFGNGK